MTNKKGFDPLDQSVPCPEFGEGAVMRFTFADLRLVEAHCNRSLALASENIREMMPVWTWVAFQLSRRDIDFAVPIFKLGLKKAGGMERLDVNWEDPPRFSVIELCAKAEIAILASLHGKTIEEAQAEAEKARAQAEGNPQNAQGEAS
jgi:hypothetical protein